MKIVTSNLLTVKEDRTVPRPWRERLFSLPWRPMVKTKTVAVDVPRKDVLVSEVMGTMFMHPATLARLRQSGAIPADWL